MNLKQVMWVHSKLLQCPKMQQSEGVTHIEGAHEWAKKSGGQGACCGCRDQSTHSFRSQVGKEEEEKKKEVINELSRRYIGQNA